ncbi:MAG: valine--tRNA ligase [Alphaproteobacteria bacterium]|nr:valine--tRNA ligase [Alphaproteobacteria bacterium]
MFPELDTNVDLEEISKKALKVWEENKIHKFTPNSGKPVFSVDTPPPYVSASHLHVGHAMSYTQAEIIVRYKRMMGFEVFYPMGFDDNGLPTERHVEQVHNIKDKSQISRSDFRKLCVQETQAGAKTYEELWRALGISVDWNLRYSTIDERCQRVGQLSFIDLYNKGLIYRAEEPVLWDTKFQTALAQADLETIERKGKLFDIEFKAESGDPLVISTTRPELIPACVGMFFNPEDERYAHLKGKNAIVPIFGHKVPILTSDKVEKEFGTGLMMVCTFGDSEDVEKWKENNLDTRICITQNGKMTELAGEYEGLQIVEARARIIKDLKEQDLVKGEKTVNQSVSVGERSEVPVEFHMAPQWFIKVLDHKERFRKRAEELEWFPDHMKVRLYNWIDGLKYDWNVSRQRYYGVPFPLWYVTDKDGKIIDTIIADEADLPVDPMEIDPPQWAKEKFKDYTIVPETDVMDTWMTSSVSPLINANWKSLDQDLTASGIYPMSLRVQAHEIIRTWLFYTMIKSEYHTDSLPWEAAMISGWGLNEQGKKISKRSLEQETDKDGYNRFNPDNLIEKYGADAVRYWAGGAKLGQDLRFSEKEIKRGKAAVTKLWNAARMAFTYMKDFDYAKDAVPLKNRTIEDQWIIAELQKIALEATGHMEKLDYAAARNIIDRVFFMTYCDNYLEMIKLRFQEDSQWSEGEIKSTQSTLFEATRMLLGLFAPFMPFVTEELYQAASKFGEDSLSLHVSAWPKPESLHEVTDKDDIEFILWALAETRKIRSEQQIGAGAILEVVTLEFTEDSDLENAKRLEKSIQTAIRAKEISAQKGPEKKISDVVAPKKDAA